jgi:hypothetical protein
MNFDPQEGTSVSLPLFYLANPKQKIPVKLHDVQSFRGTAGGGGGKTGIGLHPRYLWKYQKLKQEIS